MNTYHSVLGLVLMSAFQVVAIDDKCPCTKPKPSQHEQTSQPFRKCSCCNSCSSCCKSVPTCNCVGEGSSRKCSCCSACSKPCCKSIDRCSCHKPKPHRSTIKPSHSDSRKEDESSQRILQHFADIVENFAQIVKNPDDKNNVAEQMSHMFAGVIKIASEGMRSPTEREAFKQALAQWIENNFEMVEAMTVQKAREMRSHS